MLKAVTARFGVETLVMVEHVNRLGHKMASPLLMMHGGADPLNSLSGAKRFFESVPGPDKHMIVYPGGFHEPHHDLDRAKFLVDLRDWILGHI